MSNPRIHGDTSSLKASQAKALARLAERAVSPQHVVSAGVARELLELARELHRRVGLFIDRRGRVSRVILGDAHSLALPEFARVRGADGRLRGVRLVLTHLVPEPLSREELADLTKLQLDLVAAIHLGPGGIAVDLAGLVPEPASGAVAARVLPRVALAHLVRDDAGSEPGPELPLPCDAWIRRAEQAIVDVTLASRAQAAGTRALALVIDGGTGQLEARLAELRELCRTARIHLVDVVVQRRTAPDPRTFFGSGKLDEVLVRALEQDVELLICDPELTASQAKVIAEATELKVIDRTMLILDIFAQHAMSSDGKLQVELAQLRYRLPRMVGKGTMMSRLAGGIGGRGPGETKLEIDRRRAKDRIVELERRLARMQGQRDQRRASRRRSEVPVVAIVGYTNAGKSTLLNTITSSAVRAEDKLFATLDPTIRRIRFPREREILLLDTVGFIRALPPALRQAFSATLEEISQADLILHVVDASDPDRDQQISTVESILKELGADHVPRWLVFNKIDRLEPAASPPAPGPPFRLSALARPTTTPLMRAIEARFWHEPAPAPLPASGPAAAP